MEFIVQEYFVDNNKNTGKKGSKNKNKDKGKDNDKDKVKDNVKNKGKDNDKNKGKDNNKDKVKDSKEKKQKSEEKTSGKLKISIDIEEIKSYIYKVSKEILVRKIQIAIVKFLLQYHSTKVPFNEYTSKLVKFLNYQEFLEIVQKLIYTREITPCACLKQFLSQIGTYINDINPAVVPKSAILEASTKMLDNLDFRVPSQEVRDTILKLPEFDKDSTIFDVCYYCLQKTGKYLISCPICGVVLLCSDACNKADIKSKTQQRHHCRQIFYNAKKMKLFQVEPGCENKFRQFQKLFAELPSNSTTCLMGQYHLEQKYSPTKNAASRFSERLSIISSRNSKTLSLTFQGDRYKFRKSSGCPRATRLQPCRLAKSQGSCSTHRRSFQKSNTSTNFETPSCVYSDIHQGKKYSLPSAEMPQQMPKLTLLEHLLKSMAMSTSDQILAAPKPILLSSQEKQTTDLPPQKDEIIFTEVVTSQREIILAAADLSKIPKLETKKSIHDFLQHQEQQRSVEKITRLIDKNNNYKKTKKYFFKQSNTIKNEAPKLKSNKSVLPKAYNKFFVHFRKIFPDLDLTTLVLPYACYSNGQLYYRFLDKDPVFMETYSTV